jgi:hypothetical protein
MDDIINVDTDNLRAAAARHNAAAEYLASVPTNHAAIQESLDSLGPIFAELREAGRELLDQRKLCYEQQGADHSDLAHSLEQSATLWEEQEAIGAGKLRAVLADLPVLDTDT